ncbi:MAG: adenine phosphoribosyltransferase [Actinomycetota bacterium]
MTALSVEQLRALIRDVPDFPKPGIVFKDITPLWADPAAFATVTDLIVSHLGPGNVDVVLGIEARGFIVAAPVAYHCKAGFVPVRKAGRLPSEVEARSYALEYSEAVLEIHGDAIKPGQRVAIVDDVLATGGTAAAAAHLVERLGGVVAGCAFVIELEFLKGRAQLETYDVVSLIQY